MAKGHVGRPTNEEVAAKKRKKLLKVLIPGTLVAVGAVMLIGRSGLRELMGAYTGNCFCDTANGWRQDIKDQTKCYKESTETFVLGDVVDNDNKVTYKDLLTIKNAVENDVQLDDKQKIIYDLNGDGVVNLIDIQGMDMSSVGVTASNKIINCPSKSNNSSVTYSFDATNKKCMVTFKEIKEASATCSNGSTGAMPSNNSNEVFGDSDDQALYNLKSNESDVEHYYDYTNKIWDNEPEKFEDYDYLDQDSSFVEDVEDVAIVSKNSNQLEYAADTNQNSTGAIAPLGYIYLQTINSVNRKSVQSAVKYGIYRTSKCDENPNDSGQNPAIYLDKTNYKLVDSKNNKITKITYGIPILDRYTNEFYIKQLSKPVGYESNNECKKIPLEYIDGLIQTKNGLRTNQDYNKPKHYKEFKKRIKISNKPNSYVVTVSEGTIINGKKQQNNTITTYYDDTVKIENTINKDLFKGWTLTRTNANGGNKQTYCYDSTKTKKSWQNSCDSSNVVLFGQKGSISFSKVNAKKNYKLMFTSNWNKSNSPKLNVTLMNGSTVYNKSATINLYSDKKCTKLVNEKNVVNSMNTKNGKTEFTNLTINKKYYLKAKSTYSTGSNCVGISIVKTNIDKKIDLPLNKYIIKFDSNGGTGNMSNQKVKINSKATISSNKFKMKNKKFSYWTASTGNTIYCYANSKKNSGIWISSINGNKCQYGQYRFKNKNSINNLVNPGQVVTLKANWKKK